jgi:hypothetical protein
VVGRPVIGLTLCAVPAVERRSLSTSMDTLEYNTPQSRPMTCLVTCVLAGLPLAAPIFALFSFVHWLDEPFGNLIFLDVGIFLGVPVTITASLVA